MIHWSCEKCIVRAMCKEACEEVERHECTSYACSVYMGSE